VVLLSCNPEEKQASLSPDPATSAKDRIKQSVVALMQQRQQCRQTSDPTTDIANLEDVTSDAGTTDPMEEMHSIEAPANIKPSASARIAALAAALTDTRNQ